MKITRSFRLLAVLILLLFCQGLIFGQAEKEALNKTNANGQKQGEWKVNYPDGNLRYHGFFADGKPVGTFQYYDSTGTLKAVNEFKSNSQTAYHQAFAESGFVIAKGNFVNQQKDSAWIYYNAADSTLISEENFQNGTLHGKSITYYANEEPAEILHYDRGVLQGQWKKYFANGVLQTAAFYENGQLHGAFVSYHPNGQEHLSGSYQSGQKIGIWMTYDEEGNILNEDEHKIIE